MTPLTDNSCVSLTSVMYKPICRFIGASGGRHVCCAYKESACETKQKHDDVMIKRKEENEKEST